MRRFSLLRIRLFFQVIYTIITNGYLYGFFNGKIYKGSLKYACVPGLNCYSCPGAVASCPLGALQAALNENTIWTWNAIGKRKGAWALDETAPEATKGFLLNHLIHELLPPRGDGLRWANSDPITGQAAWFDLRVKIEKSAIPNEAQPVLPAITSPVPKGPTDIAWTTGT